VKKCAARLVERPPAERQRLRAEGGDAERDVLVERRVEPEERVPPAGPS
jgi:hypothetical protein